MKQIFKDILPQSVVKPLQNAVITMKILPQKRNFEQEVFPSINALKCEVAYNRFGAYCVPLSSKHRPAAQRVLRNAIYEEDTIEYMRKNNKGGDIIHAGTYFGDFLKAFFRYY